MTAVSHHCKPLGLSLLSLGQTRCYRHPLPINRHPLQFQPAPPSSFIQTHFSFRHRAEFLLSFSARPCTAAKPQIVPCGHPPPFSVCAPNTLHAPPICYLYCMFGNLNLMVVCISFHSPPPSGCGSEIRTCCAFEVVRIVLTIYTHLK